MKTFGFIYECLRTAVLSSSQPCQYHKMPIKPITIKNADNFYIFFSRQQMCREGKSVTEGDPCSQRSFVLPDRILPPLHKKRGFIITSSSNEQATEVTAGTCLNINRQPILQRLQLLQTISPSFQDKSYSTTRIVKG